MFFRSISKSSLGKKKDVAKSLGILFTGYVDKQNPVGQGYHKRFLVLTTEALHWFHKTEVADLFGQERGHLGLEKLTNVRILDEDSAAFEIESEKTTKRQFRCASPGVCEEWVSAIRSAIKSMDREKSHAQHQRRKSTFSKLSSIFEEQEDENELEESTMEVLVTLVSLKCVSDNREIVISRDPSWGHMIFVPNVCYGDELFISTSNGGQVALSYEDLREQAGPNEFERPVQKVTLASSLRLSVNIPGEEGGGSGGIGAGGFATGSGSGGGGGGGGGRDSSKSGYFQSLALSLQTFGSDRRRFFTFILSVMVILTFLSALSSFSPETSLFSLFSLLLSINGLYHSLFSSSSSSSSSTSNWKPSSKSSSSSSDSSTSSSSTSSSSSSNIEYKKLTFSLSILGHAFTSPDAPVVMPEEEIPRRFIDGCNGDLKEARRRWDITRKWREEEGVNRILLEKMPHFHTIKSLYPHYHAGRGKAGHVVYYERPGDIEIPQLSARGIKMEELGRHWLFVTEYQWESLCEGDPLAKSIAVLDIETVGIGALVGDALEFVRKSVGWANAHYPERSYVIFIINAPWYFSGLWKIIKPWVHENTQKKVRILSRSETLTGLQEHIDISQIPVFYGGQMRFGPEDAGKDCCRFHSTDEVKLAKYVQDLNAGLMTEERSPYGRNMTTQHPTPSDGGGGGGSPAPPVTPSSSSLPKSTTSPVPSQSPVPFSSKQPSQPHPSLQQRRPLPSSGPSNDDSDTEDTRSQQSSVSSMSTASAIRNGTLSPDSRSTPIYNYYSQRPQQNSPVNRK